MLSNLIQLFLVVFFGGIATYDTLMSNRKMKNGEGENSGKLFKLQN